MAIGFARGRHLQRSKGHSAGRSIAYEHGLQIRIDRTGQTYNYTRRSDVVHAEILLPPGADPSLADPEAFANAMENRENRKDSQIGYQVVLAVPKELSREDMIELLRDAAREIYLERGAGVSIALHPPHEGEANWHGHLTGTRRKIEGDRLTDDIQYNGAVRTWKGRRNVVDPNQLGQWWTTFQNAWFEERGLDVRVDPPNPVGQMHLGPERFRDDDARALAEEQRKAVVVACHEPAAVLAALTKNSPTFDARDLRRLLVKNVRPEAVDFVSRRVLADESVIRLVDPVTGVSTGRYTTREVRAREEAILAAADEAKGRWYGVIGNAPDQAAERHGLDAEQRAAVDACTSGHGLTIVTGDPGTGKTRTLAAVRDAFESRGHRVVFLAPTNVVAAAARRDGFREAGTVHSALWWAEHVANLPPPARPRPWDRNTVVACDEAAMLDSSTLLALLEQVNQTGARLLLLGDEKQLPSVSAGGMFAVLARRSEPVYGHEHRTERLKGTVRLTQIRRQLIDWQRQASTEMAAGQYFQAMRRYQLEGRILWCADAGRAVERLVAKWAEDSAEHPGRSRLCIAATNAAVDALNAGCRAVLRERGKLGRDHWFETDRGPMPVAMRDRLLITGTAKKLGLANGMLGTVTRVERGLITLRCGDRPEEWREVTIPTDEFKSFRHGFATTVHKSQGSTIDETYVLVTKNMRRNLAFVGATRHRHDCHFFVSADTARSVEGLVASISRADQREASVAWETADQAEWLLRRAASGAAYDSLRRDEARARQSGNTFVERFAQRLLDVTRRWFADQETVPESVVLDPVKRQDWMQADPAYSAAKKRAYQEVQAEIAAKPPEVEPGPEPPGAGAQRPSLVRTSRDSRTGNPLWLVAGDVRDRDARERAESLGASIDRDRGEFVFRSEWAANEFAEGERAAEAAREVPGTRAQRPQVAPEGVEKGEGRVAPSPTPEHATGTVAAPVDWSSAIARNQELLANLNAPTSDVTPIPVVPQPLGRPALPGEVPPLLPNGEPATLAAPPEIVAGAIAVTTRVTRACIIVTELATGHVTEVTGGAVDSKRPTSVATLQDLPPGKYHVRVRRTPQGAVLAEGRVEVVAGQTTALDLSKSTSTADDLAGRNKQGPQRCGPDL